jgi:hypothetical protein
MLMRLLQLLQAQIVELVQIKLLVPIQEAMQELQEQQAETQQQMRKKIKEQVLMLILMPILMMKMQNQKLQLNQKRLLL